MPFPHWQHRECGPLSSGSKSCSLTTFNDDGGLCGSIGPTRLVLPGLIKAIKEVSFGWPFALHEAIMPKGPFLPNEFVPTQFSTSAEKANFGNALLHFLDANCARELFTKKFYNRLSMTFGHIAHYDIEGFYSTWFTGDRHRLGFVQKLLHWPCHGDPKFTFSDVEHAVQQIMLKRNYLERYELRANEALRAAELREFNRLQAKYRLAPAAGPEEGRSQDTTRCLVEAEDAPPSTSVQMSLF